MTTRFCCPNWITKRQSPNKYIMCSAHKSSSQSTKTKETLFKFHDERNSKHHLGVLLATQIKRAKDQKSGSKDQISELSDKNTATFETKFWTQLSIECINLFVEQLESRVTKKVLGTDSSLNASVLSTLTLMFLVVFIDWTYSSRFATSICLRFILDRIAFLLVYWQGNLGTN